MAPPPPPFPLPSTRALCYQKIVGTDRVKSQAQKTALPYKKKRNKTFYKESLYSV